MNPSAFLARQFDAINAIFQGAPLATARRRLSVTAVANGSRGLSVDGLRARAAVKQREYEAGKSAGREFRHIVETTPATFFVVRMARVSPKALDDDNLASAFKTVRDGVADSFGLNDRDPRVRFVVDQWGTEPGADAVVQFALYAVATSGAQQVDLPPERLRVRKARTKRVAVARRPDAKWWRNAPVSNVRRPR